MGHRRPVFDGYALKLLLPMLLVALQLTSYSSLPEMNYLLLLDKLYILSYAFVVVTSASRSPRRSSSNRWPEAATR